MWKNGKEGDTEGDESWKEKTGDGRRETIEAEEKKRSQGKGGGDAASLQGAPRGHLAEV